MLKVEVLLAAALTLSVDGDTDRTGAAPACVTVTVWAGTPAPETVNVAVLGLTPALVAAVTVRVALFDPEVLLNVSQLWLLLAVQLIFEVMPKVEMLFAAAFTLSVDGDTDRTSAAPACVTVTVWAFTPAPETVTVAVLGLTPAFAAAVTVRVVLFDPVLLLNVSQVWLLLAVQLIFEVMPKVEVLFAAAFTLSVDGDIDRTSAAPACVTVTVWAVTPAPETVTVAVLGLTPAFAAAVTVRVALFDPVVLLKVSQLWLLLAVQLIFEVMSNMPLLFADEPMAIVFVERFKKTDDEIVIK